MILRFFFLFFLFSPFHFLLSQTIQTQLNPEQCIPIDKNEADGYLSQLCDGALGYRVVLHEDDLRQTINLVDPKGYEYPLDLWHHVSTHFSRIIPPLIWQDDELLIELEEEQADSNKKTHLIRVKLADKHCIFSIEEKNITKSKIQNESCRFPVEQKRQSIIASIQSVQRGDNACYLKVISLDKKASELPAVFELCEQNLLKNWPYYLQYQEQNIISASCEGDMNCKAQQRVQLVSRAIPIISKRPKRLFECSDSNNTFHLNWDGNTAILSFNQQMIHFAKQQLKGKFAPYSGGGGIWLKLADNNQHYIVYSGTGKWGEHEQIVSKQGVEVFNGNTTKQSFQCTSSFSSEITPDWFELWKISPSVQEFDFSKH